MIREHLDERLIESFELAKSLGTNMIIIFSPVKENISDETLLPNSIQLLNRATEAAKEHHMTLALENGAAYPADTGTNAANLVRAARSQRLLINWDPFNAYFECKIHFQLDISK